MPPRVGKPTVLRVYNLTGSEVMVFGDFRLYIFSPRDPKFKNLDFKCSEIVQSVRC